MKKQNKNKIRNRGGLRVEWKSFASNIFFRFDCVLHISIHILVFHTGKNHVKDSNCICNDLCGHRFKHH